MNKTFNNSSQLAGNLPQTHPLFNGPTDFGCFSGLRWRTPRSPRPDDSMDEDIRCIGLLLTVHGNEWIDYSSKMILRFFCFLSFVAACCYGSRNAIQHESIYKNIHELE